MMHCTVVRSTHPLVEQTRVKLNEMDDGKAIVTRPTAATGGAGDALLRTALHHTFETQLTTIITNFDAESNFAGTKYI